MLVKRRTNIIWGLLAFGIALMVLLYNLEVIPAGLYDWLSRSWPILLVVTGLIWLLRGRIPLGSIAAVALSGAMLGGVGLVAYSNQVDERRTENEVTLTQEISDEATLVVVNVNLINTDFTLQHGTGDAISGTFTGSAESEIVANYDDSGVVTVEYTIDETQPNQFPRLDAIGRGTFDLRIPEMDNREVAINVTLDDGLVTLNLSDLPLRLLTLNLENGNAVVTLPEYQPILFDPAERPGQLTVNNGDLTIIVPDDIDARVIFDRRGSGIEPEFDGAYINQRDLSDGILRRDVESAEIRLYYEVVIPRGTLRLEVDRE